MSPSALVNILAMFVVVLVAVTVIGLISLWPDEGEIPRPEGLVSPQTEKAEVVGVRSTPCGGGVGRPDCLRVSAVIESGPDKGDEITFTFAAAEGEFAVGDAIRVYKNRLPPEAVVGGVRVDRYSFSDFERRPPMLWLGAVFAALVLATGRWQGLRALAGLAASLAVIIFFIVPAILEGRSPTTVAFVGALAVMLVTLPLGHGIGPKTMAASLGTAVSLGLTLLLADAFTGFAHLSGISSEEAVYLRATQGELSLRGLLLAGMVIGALGVATKMRPSSLGKAHPSHAH